MPALEDGIVIGLVVLALDFLAWRLLSKEVAGLRFVVRCALFAALSFVLFKYGMSPLQVAPWGADPVRHILAQALELMWWLQGAQIFTVLLDRVLLPEAWHRERLFQDVLGALVFLAAAVAAIAYVLELPVGGLLATSGAVAVILGLAIQSTLNDVFSGVVLNATQPFSIGDFVSIGDVDGQVVENNWRATSLLNSMGNIVVVPNSVAAKANIINESQPIHMHGITAVLHVAPEVRPSAVLEALKQATLSTRDVLALPEPTISVRGATPDAIEYEILCFVDSLKKKGVVRNNLFDFAHRHLAARDIELRSLSAPIVPAIESSGDAYDARRLLRSVTMFQTLEAQDLDALGAALSRHYFGSGETVYASAEAKGNTALHILAYGVAKVTMPRHGEDVELRRMVPGDSIGQSAILSGLEFRVTVRAITRVVIYRLEKEALTGVLSRRPDIGREMCRLLAEHHEAEETVLSDVSPLAPANGSFLEWLRLGMRKFHDLTS